MRKTRSRQNGPGPRSSILALALILSIAQLHRQTFLYGAGNEIEIDDSLCFGNMVKADILEDDKVILCANPKQIKLINYAVNPPTSKLILDLSSTTHTYTNLMGISTSISPEITDLINYDTTGLIYVGFNSYRVIAYDLPEPYSDMSPGNIAVVNKVFNLPNLLNQGIANPIKSIDQMRNMDNFLVAELGQGASGIFRFDQNSNQSTPNYSTMIVASGYAVVKIKHLEELNWIGISKYSRVTKRYRKFQSPVL